MQRESLKKLRQLNALHVFTSPVKKKQKADKSISISIPVKVAVIRLKLRRSKA